MFNVNRLRTNGFRPHSHGENRKANALVRTRISASTEIRGVLNVYDMPFWENPSTLTLTEALNRPTSIRQPAIDQGFGETSSQQQGGLTIEHLFAGGQMSPSALNEWST
jgi:hypothetical protein